jgi:hypothetical protein
VTEHLAWIGSELRRRFAAAAAEAGVRGEVMGPDARMTLALHDHGLIMREDLTAIFILESARQGVLTNGMLLPSYAHDEDSLDRTADAFSAAFELIARLTSEADEAMRAAMRQGFVSRNGAGGEAQLPDGCIDLMRAEGNHMTVVGWMLLEDGWPDLVEFVGAAGGRVVAEPVFRGDLEAAYPQIEGCANSGFRADLPRWMFAAQGDWDFTMLAKRGAETVFSCRVQRKDPWTPGDGSPRWSDGVLRI